MRNMYRQISQHELDVEDKECLSQHASQASLPPRWRVVLVILSTLLILSSVVNISHAIPRPHPLLPCEESSSQYAHLRRNVLKDIAAPLRFSDSNRTIQDAAWDDPSLLSWELYVALSDEYTVSQGLPRSQRWPWDLSKGVYTITAGHELHCVRVIRSVLLQNRDGVPEEHWEWEFSHAVHCLNVLRETIMCNADDTPLYVGKLHANAHSPVHLPGNGMMRKCRDWDSLMDWAHRHSACYLSAHREDPEFDELERYKFCPDGTRPWEAAREG